MRAPERLPDADALLEHAAFVRALAHGLLAAPDQADDVLQETWLAALRHPPRAATNVRAWLGVVARNLAFRFRRSARRRDLHESRAGRAASLPSAAELAERMELQRRVLDAVERLEEPYRATLLYRYFDGLAPREIAERLRVPVKTVKSRLHRALRALRADLGRAYGGDSTWRALLLPLVWPAATGVGGPAAAGGIVLAMKKWIALAVIALCLLGTGAVLWETSGRAKERPVRTELARQRGVAPDVPAEPATAVPPRPPVVEVSEMFTFEGRVVDPDGNGVAAAELRLVYWTAGSQEIEDCDDKRIRREREQRERPATRADTEGYFRFGRPYPSKSHVVAYAEGFAPAVSEACEPGEFLLIRMTRGAPLRVTVADAGGQAVAGAAVRLVTTPLGRSWRAVLAETSTGGAGTAELPVPGDEGLWLEVDPEDPALGAFQGRVPAGAEEMVVNVRACTVRTCRIVDGRTASPLADAYVIACHRDAQGPVEGRRFRADANGCVRVPQSLEYLFATAPGYEVAPVGAAEVRLWPAARIEGRVFDEQRQAVPDVAIVLAHPPGSLFASTFLGLGAVSAWTDDEGRFAVDVVTARQGREDAKVRTVIALHPAHAPAVADGIVVEPGTARSVELRFPPPATVAVEVVDPAGAPVPEQWVTLCRVVPSASAAGDGPHEAGVNMVSLRDGQHTLVTDANGRVEATGLPPGRYVVRSESSLAEGDVAEGSRTTLTIVKGGGPSISGRLVHADGSPAAAMWVGLLGAPAQAGKQTDADGRFRFTDLPDFRLADIPGARYVLQITLLPWRGVLEVPVELGDDREITVPAGPARLRVEVEGVPPDFLMQYMLATREGGRAPRERWAAVRGGVFETDPFTPGSGLLFVRAGKLGTAEVEFDAAEDRTTTVLVRLAMSGGVGGTASGFVDRAEGGACYVRLTRLRGGDLPRRLKHELRDLDRVIPVGADGSFRSDDVPPGRYRAELRQGAREIAVQEVEVRSGERTTIPLGAR